MKEVTVMDDRWQHIQKLNEERLKYATTVTLLENRLFSIPDNIANVLSKADG